MIHEHSTKSYEEHKLSGKRDSWRRRVYDFIKEHQGITDRDVMIGLDEQDPNNIRPEITRLKQDGLIFESGKTRCRVTNKTVRILKTTTLDYFDRNETPSSLTNQDYLDTQWKEWIRYPYVDFGSGKPVKVSFQEYVAVKLGYLKEPVKK